jgi:hypothetical protein
MRPFSTGQEADRDSLRSPDSRRLHQRQQNHLRSPRIPRRPLRRQRNHLRSPRALHRPRLAALLTSLPLVARCGACVVGAGRSPLALRVRQERGSLPEAAALPFPRSRGPPCGRPRAPGPRSGRPAGSGNRKRARASPVEAAPAGSVPELPSVLVSEANEGSSELALTARARGGVGTPCYSDR